MQAKSERRSPACLHAKPQGGQAIAEFLVVAAVFSTCLLCMPFLARLAELKLATTQAARHAAWDRTVWRNAADNQTEKDAVVKEDAKLQNEIRHHFFSSKELRNEADESKHEHIAEWRDARTQTRALAAHDDVTVSTTDDMAPGWLNTNIVSNMLDGAAIILGGLNKLTTADYIFDVDFKGLHAANVNTAVSPDYVKALWNIVAPGESPPALKLSSDVVVIGGEWNGGGSERTKKKVMGLVLTGFTDAAALRDLRSTLKQVDEVMNKFSGAGKRYVEFGMDPTKVADESIPDDRKEETKEHQDTDAAKFKYAQYKFSPPIAYYVEMPLGYCMNAGVPDPTSEICKLQ